PDRSAGSLLYGDATGAAVLNDRRRTVPDSIIRGPAEVTSEWLATAIDRAGVEVRSVAPIGTGQMSQSHRVSFVGRDGAEATVVVKLASEDPTSRATGVGMGAYEREISFYRNLAGRIGGPLPRC